MGAWQAARASGLAGPASKQDKTFSHHRVVWLIFGLTCFFVERFLPVFEVKVRPRRTARHADRTDPGADSNLITHHHIATGKLREPHLAAIAKGDLDRLAIGRLEA